MYAEPRIVQLSEVLSYAKLVAHFQKVVTRLGDVDARTTCCDAIDNPHDVAFVVNIYSVFVATLRELARLRVH